MIPKLFIHRDLDILKDQVNKTLSKYRLTVNDPNVLVFDETQKLGVEQTKKIRAHLSTKPYSGSHQAVVVFQVEQMTIEAQNSLLKTLEEPPGESLIIMSGRSTDTLLPTILSRSEIINLEDIESDLQNNKFLDKIKQLEKGTLEQRFSFLEKLDEKEEFLNSTTQFYREKLFKDPEDLKLVEFVKELIKAQRLVDQNVTIRAILEYLMLKMPFDKGHE